MPSIVAKRHYRKFYFAIFSGFMYAPFFIYLHRDMPTNITFKTAIIGIGLLWICLATYTFIRYSKNVPVIKIDDEKISFNSEVYSWQSLDRIQLKGYQPFKYIINFPMKGLALQFKDGTIKYIFEEMYSNADQIKSFIEERFFTLQAKATSNPTAPTGEHNV